MFCRRLKLSHTRCFLPAFVFDKNVHDEEGTESLGLENAGGWQGVVKAFSFDEDGNPSPDVRAIFSTIVYSSLMGGLYGSLSYSKRAYVEFFEKNQSTLFKSQFDAKAKLQSKVTLAMARGVMKWGTRVVLFCGPFTTIVTAMNAYFQNVSLVSYATAGFIVGGIARLFFGLRGILVGSTLGAILGLFAGSITLLVLKLMPVTMEDLKEWQDQSQRERDAYFVKEQRTSIVYKYDEPSELLEHERRLKESKNISDVKNDGAKLDQK